MKGLLGKTNVYLAEKKLTKPREMEEENMNNLMSQVAENAIFLMEFLGVVTALVLVAYFVEKWEKKKNGSF